MSSPAAAPVARVVRLAGGDLADRAVVEAVQGEIVPRFHEVPGFLGTYGMLDPETSAVVGVQVWRDEAAYAESEAVVATMNEAVALLSSATTMTSERYELVHNRPPVVEPGAPAPTWDTHPAARLVTVEGGNLTDPAVLDTMVTYQSTYLPSVPGCLSAMLLLDPLVPTILDLSIWTDVAAAARTVERTSQLARDVAEATRGSTGSAHVYRVMVSEPVRIAHPPEG